MKAKLTKCLVASSLALTGALPLVASAGGTIEFDQDKSVTVGFGMISDLSATENAANAGKSYSNDASLDNARIYLSGSVNKYISGMLNYETQGSTVIDANVQIKPLDNFTVWIGRMLSPSDRANMAGPFYALGGGWTGNDITARYSYNGGHIGRDDGVAITGSLADGMLSYAGGVYEGHTEQIGVYSDGYQGTFVTSTQNQKDGFMYAGRVQLDLWDKEGSSLYGTGDYRGGADILAVGLSGKYQKDGASAGNGSSVTQAGNYSQYSIDFLLEKKDIGPGAIHIGGAYYRYDTDDVFKAEQGNAYQAEAAYTFNEKFGWGKFQPFAQYQKFDSDAVITTERKYDIGLAYVIDPYNAEISAKFINDKLEGKSSTNEFMLMTQFQF
jgi:hypothetical protein